MFINEMIVKVKLMLTICYYKYILSNSIFDRKANKEKEKEDKNNI